EAVDCAHIATAGQPCTAQELATRRASLDEVGAIAEEINPKLFTRFLCYGMVTCLEKGDFTAFEAHLAQYRAMAGRMRTHFGDLKSIDVLRAILQGDFAVAERRAEEALQDPSGVDDGVVTGVYGMQMFTIRREQGRLAEVAPLVKRFVAERSRDASW